MQNEKENLLGVRNLKKWTILEFKMYNKLHGGYFKILHAD